MKLLECLVTLLAMLALGWMFLGSWLFWTSHMGAERAMTCVIVASTLVIYGFGMFGVALARREQK